MSEDKFKSVFLHEGQRYTQAQLIHMLEASEGDGVRILKRLKEYGILKTIKNQNDSVDLSELVEEQIELSEVRVGDNGRYYVSSFVGVIMVEGRVLKCYPKYLPNDIEPVDELKQILKVLDKFNRKEQIIHMQNESERESSFNLLAVMLYLLQDYYDYGLYTNTQEIIETNGNGEILWDKTINETFTLISNNRPYYPELLTRKRVTNDYDYFRRLHACVLTECSALLKDSKLTELFNVDTVELSTEQREDFGDDAYILHRIGMELNVQYNTHKQLLLKTLYAYIAHGGVQNQDTGFSMYGTNSFHVVWEKACAEVLGNQLDKPMKNLNVPIPYDSSSTLKQFIEKPKWVGVNEDGTVFSVNAQETLEPDIIGIEWYNSMCYFMIYDAKYYSMQFEPGLLNKQPGIESITKQYLYQQAYREFINAVGVIEVRNCFLMPTCEERVINKGVVRLGMLEQFGLQPIEIRLLPATEVYRNYLQGEKYKVEDLELFDNTSSAATMMKMVQGNKYAKMYPGGTSTYGKAADSKNNTF